MNNKWNNKSGTKVKGAAMLTLVMVISVGMLTACTKSDRQDAVDSIRSSQIQPKNNDAKKSTVGTTETQGRTNIQGTENKDVPATDTDKGTIPEVENKEADTNIPAEENKDMVGTEQKKISAADSDKNMEGGENKETAETEQKVPSEADANKEAEDKEKKEADAGKNAESKEQKKADAEKNTESKEQTDTKMSTVDSGKK